LPQAPDSGPQTSPTAIDLLVRFEDEILDGQSTYTILGHQDALVRFARWLEPRSMLEASPTDVTDWLHSLALPGTSFREHAAGLHRFYHWLLTEGLVDRNPAARLARERHLVTPEALKEWMRGWRTAQERKELLAETITRRECLLRDFIIS
jgi:site-specific recombinase XerD